MKGKSGASSGKKISGWDQKYDIQVFCDMGVQTMEMADPIKYLETLAVYNRGT